MTALKARAGSLPALIAIVLAIGILIGVALVGIGAEAGTSPTKAVAHSACRHFVMGQPSTPCKVGNIVVECGYGLGSCEYSRYLKCKMSAEKGQHVKVVENGEVVLEHLANTYKTVKCHGSATILKAYFVEFTYHYQPVTKHGKHSLTVTLHYRHNGFRADGLLIFAQH
jgi:xanthosine utilization system XapX-like protein